MKQKGMSMLGFLMVICLVAFVGLTAIKLVPAYMEFRSVKQAMDAAVSQEEGAGQNTSVAEIRESLAKRLSMNYVESVKASDIKITSEGGGYKAAVDYQTERPLAGNVYFLLKFKHEATTK